MDGCRMGETGSIDESSSIDKVILRTLADNAKYTLFKDLEQEENKALLTQFMEYKAPSIHNHNNMYLLVSHLMEEYKDMIMSIGCAYKAAQNHCENTEETVQQAYEKVTDPIHGTSNISKKVVKSIDDIREGVFIAHKYFGIKTPLWGTGIVDDEDIATFVHDELREQQAKGASNYKAIRETLRTVEDKYGSPMPVRVMKGYLCRMNDDKGQSLKIA